MKIGFIGAGKVGFSLGKYFTENGLSVSGYYSRSRESAIEAAKFTHTKPYNSVAELLEDNDTIFITTSDTAIASIWDQMKNLNVKNKNICHCSGSISSTVFFNGEKLGAHIYSVHPLYAISDKYNSWKTLSNAHFTIEGSKDMTDILAIFQKTGNNTTVISKDSKALYHCAAVAASNLAIAVFKTAIDMLTLCGFSSQDATQSLLPLYTGNTSNMEAAIENGQPLEKALTGPIERGDLKTIEKHLAALSDKEDLATLYKLLSQQLVDLGKRKDESKDYSEIEEVLKR